jgi:pyrroline-5-carboxylate reductase
MNKTKITIIGNGKMALALIDGLKQRYDITIIARDITKNPELNSKQLIKNTDITDQIVLLCVKPNSLQDVCQNLTGKATLLISILAGVSIKVLSTNLKAKSYIRAMPNLAATYKQSTTSITGDKDGYNIAKDIFGSIGQTIWLDSQKELDIATAIAGSGPAFLAIIAEALSDGGVNAGLKRDDSNFLVSSLFASFTPLIKHNKPSQIKDNVMSPGGTTSAGVATLEAHSIRSAFIKAIADAKNRADKLG